MSAQEAQEIVFSPDVAERRCAVAERSDRSDMPKSVERSSRHQTCREEPMLFDMPERRRRSAASDTSAAGAHAEYSLEFDMNAILTQALDSAQIQRVMDAIKLLMAYRILKLVRVGK